MTLRLSNAGSDRATAYITSNKIVRQNGRMFVGWLDAPEEIGRLAAIRLGVFDEKSGTLARTLTLGMAYDNHCGPALAADGSGRLHAIIGAHHNPFLYRWSDHPEDPGSWSEPVALGPFATYPSLVADREGTLHLAHRHMDDRWQLWYRRKRFGQPWEPWVVLAISPVPGYNHFYQSLSLGPGGALHLLFQFCYADSGKSADATGRMAVHLRSDDGGDTWCNENRRCELPVTVTTAVPICHYPGGGMRISNHVVDENDEIWFSAQCPERHHPTVFRSSGSGYKAVDTSAAFGKLSFHGGRETCLSRDASGSIHLAAGTNPDGGRAKWFDPRHEIFHLKISADGQTEAINQISKTNPSGANWLPALEHWDWTRSESCCANGPALAFTCGTTAGKGTNTNTLKTEVYLVPGL